MTSQKGSGVANFRILIPLSIFSDQRTYPYQICDRHDHFIDIHGDLGIFGPFWAKLGVRDVTKGVNILRFWNSDTTTGFLTPQNMPKPDLGKK